MLHRIVAACAVPALAPRLRPDPALGQSAAVGVVLPHPGDLPPASRLMLTSTTELSMAPASAAPAETTPASALPNHQAFDRAAFAIFGTMVSLIVVLTALLITVSAPASANPAPTAQTSPPPHRA